MSPKCCRVSALQQQHEACGPISALSLGTQWIGKRAAFLRTYLITQITSFLPRAKE
jgi:hypothetical protein